MNVESIFDELWDRYGELLLDRQQQALWRCLAEQPDRCLRLFIFYIAEGKARQVAPPSPRPAPPALALPPRRCLRCGGPNYRAKNKICYSCYRASYVAEARPRRRRPAFRTPPFDILGP